MMSTESASARATPPRAEQENNMFGNTKTRWAAIVGAGLTVTDHASKAEMCRSEHIDHTAPVISAGDILIQAPIETVFHLQTDVDNWASWRPDVVFATRLQTGPLASGSSFRWETGGLTVVSTVRAVRNNSCTVWGGPAGGIQGEHLWTYTEVPGGVLVHTEESWSGPPVDADVAGAQAALDSSLQVWRADLKRQAEALTRQHH